MSKIVTIFKNIKRNQHTLSQRCSVYTRQNQERNEQRTDKKNPQTADKSQRNELKKNLPAICFSGKFSKRNSDSIVEHSGLLCLDFDGYKKEQGDATGQGAVLQG